MTLELEVSTVGALLAMELCLAVQLEWDPNTEKFKGEKEANKMVFKDYRKLHTFKAKIFA